MMKIAVASQNRKTVTAHAGKCRKFWLYTVEAGLDGAAQQSRALVERTLLELPIEQSFHAHHGPEPHPLQAQAVQVLISGGMGEGLQRRLASMGIEGLITSESDPDRAVTAWLKGELPRMAPQAHAGGHDHPHD